MEHRRDRRRRLRSRCLAGALRARTVPGDPRGDLAPARAAGRGHRPHPHLRPQSGLEPASRAASGPKPQRRSLPTAGFATARLAQRPLAHAAAGDGRTAAIWMTPTATPDCVGLRVALRIARAAVSSGAAARACRAAHPVAAATAAPGAAVRASVARRAALAGGLRIVRLRLGRGTPAPRQPQDLEFGRRSMHRQAEPIADAHAVRRLHPLRRSHAPCRR